MSAAAREENLVGAKLDLCTDRCFARRSHRLVTVGAESHRVGWHGAANLGFRRVLPFGRCSGCSCILARSHHLTSSTYNNILRSPAAACTQLIGHLVRCDSSNPSSILRL